MYKSDQHSSVSTFQPTVFFPFAGTNLGTVSNNLGLLSATVVAFI